jgi:protein CMS1
MARTKEKSRDGLKRKRDDKHDISTLATKKAATSPSSPSAEIDEKNDTTKQGPRKLNRLPEAIDIDEAIGYMDNSLLADHFAKQIRRHLGDLSTVELEEKYMPLKAFLNTSEFESIRNLSTLPQYIEKFTPGGRDELKSTVDATSSPHTLFIASSGIRAADLTRFAELQQLHIIVSTDICF